MFSERLFTTEAQSTQRSHSAAGPHPNYFVVIKQQYLPRGAILLAPWLQPGDQEFDESSSEPFQRFLVVSLGAQENR